MAGSRSTAATRPVWKVIGWFEPIVTEYDREPLPVPESTAYTLNPKFPDMVGTPEIRPAGDRVRP